MEIKEDILGVIKVDRPKRRLLRLALRINEELIITSHRVLVIRKWIEHLFPPPSEGIMTYGFGQFFFFRAYYNRKDAQNKKEFLEKEKQPKTLEELLMSHKENFAIANSEIMKVELKASSYYTYNVWGGKPRGTITIVTEKWKYSWYYGSSDPDKKAMEFEDYEKLLEPVFGHRLSIEK